MEISPRFVLCNMIVNNINDYVTHAYFDHAILHDQIHNAAID